MILDNLICTPVYLIYSRTINAFSIVVYYCPPLFFVFYILIVLIVRTSYSLYRTPIVCPLLIVSNYRHSFCLVCRTHTLLSGYRTIACTCISSVACTPWFISSLNCCPRHSSSSYHHHLLFLVLVSIQPLNNHVVLRRPFS